MHCFEWCPWVQLSVDPSKLDPHHRFSRVVHPPPLTHHCGQFSKPSLVPNISFNFKDSLCHIVSGGAIRTLTLFFYYAMHSLMFKFQQILI